MHKFKTIKYYDNVTLINFTKIRRILNYSRLLCFVIERGKIKDFMKEYLISGKRIFTSLFLSK